MTTRKTGRHIETEPDWEAAFGLQLRMMPIMTLVYDWCFSDVSRVISLFRGMPLESRSRFFLSCDFIGSRCRVFLLCDFVDSNPTWNHVHY